jgi:tubulinyl-Tyr carboxypeptidase
MIKFALPIKCLEAVVLSLCTSFCFPLFFKLTNPYYEHIDLSNGMFDIERYTLSFKSRVKKEIYRHIVLIVRYNDMFGALGLSRRNDLMYKPLVFEVSLLLLFIKTNP